MTIYTARFPTPYLKWVTGGYNSSLECKKDCLILQKSSTGYDLSNPTDRQEAVRDVLIKCSFLYFIAPYFWHSLSPWWSYSSWISPKCSLYSPPPRPKVGDCYMLHYRDSHKKFDRLCFLLSRTPGFKEILSEINVVAKRFLPLEYNLP